MRRSVHVNKSVIEKLSEEKKMATCAICINDITELNEATLDSCQHKYCFVCISKWVTEVENTCPLCKSEVKQLFIKESNSQEVKSVAVTHRRQEEIIGDCTACSEEINFADIVRSRHTEQEIENMNPDTRAVSCHVCRMEFIHDKCMHESDKEVWTATHEWLCPHCVGFQDHIMSHPSQASAPLNL